MFDCVTIGGAARDIFFNLPELKPENGKREFPVLPLPYGEKMVSAETFYSYGGGAINVSVCLSRLGLRVASFCNIGKEGTGSLVKQYLEAEKVSTKYIHRDVSLHTGLSVFILGKDSEHTGFLERGANNNLPLILPKFKTRWLYVSSLTGRSAEILPKIFEYGKNEGIRVAFNPGKIQLEKGYKYLKPFIEQTEILILNLEEATELLDSKGIKRPTLKVLLKEVGKLGATIALLTDSENGSYAVFEDNVYFQKAIETEVVDTTGAGDCFGGTFLYGIIRGFDIRYALKIAAVNSGSVVSKMGAGDGLLNYNSIKSSI